VVREAEVKVVPVHPIRGYFIAESAFMVLVAVDLVYKYN
jgi:hypothetical protein